LVNKIIVDSSIFIDYARVTKGVYPQIVERLSKKRSILYIPSSVILELWTGISMHKESERIKMKRMLKGFKIVALTRQLAEDSGDLIRSGFISGYADAVVAATALYLNAELATSNLKHFKKVKNLRIFKS
jgi:predicted nucleic acid-binding protein